MNAILKIVLLLTIPAFARAQSRTIDSLNLLLATEEQDTSRVMLLNQLSLAYRLTRPDTALALTQQALSLARKAAYGAGEARSLSGIASIFRITGNYPKALQLHLEALKKAEAIGDEKLYDFKTGDKYFFPLCINHLATDYPEAARRETTYLFEYPFEKTDTTVYQLPAGFSPEAVPAPKELKSAYSVYRRTASYDKTTNRLIVVSALTLLHYAIPAASYSEIVQFFRSVTALEEENLVLLKQSVSGA